VWLVALGLLGATMLSASPAGEATGGPQKVDMRITWWGSQARHDRTIKVIDMYMKAKPNVTITYEFASWGDYWTRLTTMAAGGNLPDVMQHDYAYIEDWRSRNLIAPLDDYVKRGVLDLSKVAQASIDCGKLGGKLYAINLGNNSLIFLLDTDEFKKAGFAIPAQSWTWDDLEKVAMDLKAKLGKWGMGTPLTNEQVWKNLYLSNGEWAYSKDGKALGYTNDQILVDHMKRMLRLTAAKAVPTAEEEIANKYRGGSVEQQAMVTGKAAMEMHWTNQIVAFWQAAGASRSFYATHMPRLKGGKPANYIKPSQFWSITSQAKFAEEGAKFISMFTNDIEANKILLAERGVPIASTVQAGLKPLLTKAQVESFDSVARVEKEFSPLPPPDPPGHPNLVNNVWWPQVIDPVFYGKITPEQAVKVLRDSAPAILSK